VCQVAVHLFASQTNDGTLASRLVAMAGTERVTLQPQVSGPYGGLPFIKWRTDYSSLVFIAGGTGFISIASLLYELLFLLQTTRPRSGGVDDDDADGSTPYPTDTCSSPRGGRSKPICTF
jgi:hypothetical protein